MRLAFLLAAVPLCAAEDPNEILKRLVEAEKQNASRIRQYTYVEENSHVDIQKDGSKKIASSETHEIIYLEGTIYRKLVAKNGQPLNKKDAAKEEEKLQRAAEERRQPSRSSGRTLTIGTNADLLTLCDNQLFGEEEIQNRKAWVIESSPKAGYVPANDREKDVLSWQTRLWIDQQDNMPLRQIRTVIRERSSFKPGTIFATDYEKINGEDWFPTFTFIDAHIQFLAVIKMSGRIEIRNSNFKKFNVDSSVSVEQ
jgi:hypothetical protein